MIRFAIGFLAAVFPVYLVASAQTAAEATLVDVELVFRGPDARTLDNKTAVITILDEPNLHLPDPIVTTDSHGIARFKLPAGVFRLGIKVRGIGYESTGAIEFRVGSIARPDLPPLAGYGAIDGFVPQTGCIGDLTVSAWSPYVGALTTQADASGHFHFDDLAGGRWFVLAYRGKDTSCHCSSGEYITVNVGEITQGVKLTPLKYAACWENPPSSAPPAAPTSTHRPAANAPVRLEHEVKSGSEVVWARGTVTDESGQPIQNATVFALGTFYGGIRMNEIVARALTDAKGYYELKGASGLSNFSATLVATAPRHPPAWAWPAFPQISWFDSDPAIPEPVTQNIVLPSKSGQLKATVLRDGRPAPGVTVGAYLENANLRDIWALGGRGRVREEIDDVAYPTSVTNARGAVEFDDLLPGQYRLYAIVGAKADLRGVASFPAGRQGVPRAIASGIPVRIGATTRHTLSLYDLPTSVSFKVMRPDGHDLAGNTPFEFGPVDRMQAMSSIALDSKGQGQWNLENEGLWEIHFIRKNDSSTGGFRAPDDFREPYDLAIALFAVSPRLANNPPLVLRGRRVDPPTARIVVQDSKGAPVHATVTIVGRQSGLSVAGSTNENGEVAFGGLRSGQEYIVHVSGTRLSNIEPIAWGYGDEPVPLPGELHTQYVLLDQTLVLAPDSPNKLVIRPQALCYVYGSIRTRSSMTNVAITHVGNQEHGLEQSARTRVSTGEYVAGPFVAGSTFLYFRTPGQQGEFPVPVSVSPNSGESVHFDIDLDKYTPDAAGETQITDVPKSYLGMGGIVTQSTGAQHLVGRVFLSDGVTPAFGAQVVYFSIGSVSPTIFAMTDALGELHPRGLWSGPVVVPAGTAPLREPVVVALLPGERGGTVYRGPIRRDKALQLNLPPAISAQGTVAIGGKGRAPRPGAIHVLAAYQDNGVLNSALSISTTADAEGHFSLAGLTPGTYFVQAALDGIWLSSTATLRVSNQKIKPIRLAIPAPGTAVQVELSDESGNPLPGHSVTIERSGPLAYLWPHELLSDGAGSIYIPTIESGRQTIHVSGESKPIEIRVPPLPGSTVVVHIKTRS